ncbi:MAG: hypothetical protein ACLQUY_10070 [Ktedonobacterales bacterium]
MPLELFMIGLVTQNVEESREFYRRLGLAIPEGTEGQAPQAPIEIKMQSPHSLLLSPNTIARESDSSSGVSQDLRVFFEYYVKTQAAVEAKYAEMVGYSYQSYRAPFLVTIGAANPTKMCFALIDDPDGNTILLSGDAEPVGGGLGPESLSTVPG